MVIDDDRLHCDLLQMALARHGYQVSTATGGREGVALFRQLRPLVTLLDLRMPDMDGLAVLRRYEPSTPGWSDYAGRRRDRGVGEPGSKLRVTVSFRLVLGCAHRCRASGGPAGSTGRVSCGVPGKREPDDASAEQILVVDDDVMARELLVRFLSLRGYRVRAARTAVKPCSWSKHQLLIW